MDVSSDISFDDRSMSSEARKWQSCLARGRRRLKSPVRRGPLSAAGAGACVCGVLVVLVNLPAIWRLSWSVAALMTVLMCAELVGGVLMLVRPNAGRLFVTSGAAAAAVVIWALTESWAVLPWPDLWTPLNATFGFTSYLCIAVQLIGVGLLGLAALHGGVKPSRLWRLASWVGAIPLTAVMLLASVVGLTTSTDGFAGAGIPAATVAPQSLPAGTRSTLEYCRPDGVPLPMDLYLPSAPPLGAAAMPVVMYVHGGGLVLGDRRPTGLGAQLGGQDAALFTPLLQQLNALGFVVASIDYRLTPAASWRAPVEDVKCAVRFLRAHADDLGIDKAHIGAWGSSAGGQLVSLLGLAGPGAGFDQGQYADQSSAVQAVVDMFGPSDLSRFGDSSGFARTMAWISLGNSPKVRRAISPITYVAAGAPPFLIVHNQSDPDIPIRQSLELAKQLRMAGVPVSMITLNGTGHSAASTGQKPSPDTVTAVVVDFLTRRLANQRSTQR